MKRKLLLLTLGLVSLGATAATPPATEVVFKDLLVEKQATSDFQSYWYVSAGAGFSQLLAGENYPKVGYHEYWKEFREAPLESSFSLSVGKQLIPWFGLQLNLGNFNFHNDFSAFNGGLDLNFDLKNIFAKYNSESFFNPVLHVGAGLDHNFYDHDNHSKHGLDTSTKEDFFFVKGGLQLNFRLSHQVSLWLDGSLYLVSDDNFGRRLAQGGGDRDAASTYQIGVTYKFNKSFFKYHITPSDVNAVNDELNRLRKANEECDQIQWLRKELEDCQNKPAPAPIIVEKTAPVVAAPTRDQIIAQYSDFEPVFFTINSSVVRPNQMHQIENAASYIKANPGAKVQLSAYADKKTGTPAGNKKLSQNRVNAVADVLVRKYGISASSLALVYFGDEEQPFDINELNRSVVFKVVK
jgi:outer membrane protein OmpA-like peptidoglycan-associated protein